MRKLIGSKNNKIILLFLIISLFSILGLFFFSQQRFQIKEISYSDIEDIVEKNNDVYIIYGSKYCIYCNNMNQTYKDIVKKIIHVYQVDLSNENEDIQQNLENEEINSIPRV